MIKSSRVLERVEKGLMFLSVGIGGYETARIAATIALKVNHFHYYITNK